jgi:single-strand DNA-binding protein
MNKVMLMGRLTKDPELRYTSANNTAVCSFALAVNRRFQKDKSDFFNIVARKQTAEHCAKYFVKGQQVIVIGSLQNRSYDDNEGRKHNITEVVADETYFADSKKVEQQSGVDPIGEDDSLPF